MVGFRQRVEEKDGNVGVYLGLITLIEAQRHKIAHNKTVELVGADFCVYKSTSDEHNVRQFYLFSVHLCNQNFCKMAP